MPTSESRPAVQFVFLPHYQRDLSTADIINQTEQAARDFYTPDSQNLLIVDVDFIPAFGYDHFFKWLKIEGGSYFRGHAQHGKTNADGENNPFTRQEMENIQAEFQILATALPNKVMDEDSASGEIFTNNALIIIDRLQVDVPNFSVVIQQESFRGVRRFFKTVQDLVHIKVSDKEVAAWDALIEERNIDALIEGRRKNMQSGDLEVAKEVRRKEDGFKGFVDKSVLSQRTTGQETRVFIPQYDLRHLTLLPRFAADFRYRVLDPVLIGDTQKLPTESMAVLADFINNGRGYVSTELATRSFAEEIITEIVEQTSLSVYLDEVRSVLETATTEEHRRFLEIALEDDGAYEILDILGNKISGDSWGEQRREFDRVMALISGTKKS